MPSEQSTSFRRNDALLQHLPELMKLAVLLALLVGVYGFIAGVAAGIAVAESTALVPAVVSVLGPTYTNAAIAAVVLLATIGILDETSSAIAIVRCRAEYGDPTRDTEGDDAE